MWKRKTETTNTIRVSYVLAQCPVGCMIRGSVRCFEQSVWLKYSVFLIFWNNFQAQNWAQILSIKTGPARALQIVLTCPLSTLQTRGKPSTWLPRGRLVELWKATHTKDGAKEAKKPTTTKKTTKKGERKHWHYNNTIRISMNTLTLTLIIMLQYY